MIIIKRICEGNNISMATSLPILQFRPFIMEDGEKLNLGVRWKKFLTKFENFLIAMSITKDKRNVLHFGGDYVRDFIDNAAPKVEGYDATVEYLNEHLNPNGNDTFNIYRFQKTIPDSKETVQQFCNGFRSIANRCNFENEDKHLKTQLILRTHSQKLCNRGTLFREVDKQRDVAEDSTNINEIKTVEKNEQSLQIQHKSLQEQINELKSIEKSKTTTQEYINRGTVQKSCLRCGRSWPRHNGECAAKEKICTK